MKATLLGVGLMVLALSFAGCAKEPAESIAAVQQSLEQARTAEASEYAPRALAAAQDAQAQLQAELDAQKKKFALFRSYGHATELATAAQQAGQQAQSEAVAGKERARTEAAELIAQTKTAIEEARQMLATAPRGKGSQTDIKALEADLASVEASLSEVDGIFSTGKYLSAKAKAQAALQAVNRVKTDVTTAIEMQKQARGK
ncbi:MAG: hypothetical protein V1774_06585 [Candidatus Eisenbacteria bacterium]